MLCCFIVFQFILHGLFIYLFTEFMMQQYKQQNSRVHNTMHTWILKDECVATYIS